MAKSVDQIERVEKTIHGLRDFMRKGELRLVHTDVAEIVQDALRLVSAEANDIGVSLLAVGSASLPLVMVDKIQIVQVLVNLLRNAVQAIDTVHKEGGAVVVSSLPTGNGVEITVTDNGPGLHPHVLAHLFEPFVTTKKTGMGLGLSISKSIIDAHRGRLWGENGSEGGAVFRFTLTLADGERENGGL